MLRRLIVLFDRLMSHFIGFQICKKINIRIGITCILFKKKRFIIQKVTIIKLNGQCVIRIRTFSQYIFYSLINRSIEERVYSYYYFYFSILTSKEDN